MQQWPICSKFLGAHKLRLPSNWSSACIEMTPTTLQIKSHDKEWKVVEMEDGSKLSACLA